MSKESSNIVVHYDSSELDPLSPQEIFVLKEFKQYKIDSLSISIDNFVAPNEGIQEVSPSVHSLFGRDRVFEHPSHLINDIHAENITHVHYNDGTWMPSMNQWHCTSMLAVVYSGFQYSDQFHFVVHDLLLNSEDDDNFDAHDSYKTEDLEYYVQNAQYLREQVEAELDNTD
ncbi:hypothetical protein L4C38_07005 [Vibrio kasasachensis]|uniref:hypothetical protein n=1 Tax=Vibrio kasasachensis TaxID=2910248 RepID=UPI003D0DB364